MKSSTRSMAAFLAVIPMSLCTLTSLAQGDNLVENGSFESTSGKVKKLGSIDLATGWVSPTGVRADLFVPGAKVPEIGSPDNFYGKETAKEGDNYAGIMVYSFNDKMPRSYVMAKLSTPLKKGMKYCVSFHVSLSELSKYSSNQIGANLGKKPFGTDAKTSIVDATHVLQADNKVMTGMYNWDKICGVFTAEGGEKYITIGNFTKNENTKNERMKKPDNVKGTQFIGAYYYIDDVSVVMLDANQPCDCAVAVEDDGISATIYQKTVVVTDKMTAKQKIELQTAYFGFGKDKLQPAGIEALNLIAAEMKANPAMKLQVFGNSDVKEEDMGTRKPDYAGMAQKRVDVVVKYLTEQGIAANRLTGIAQGSDQQSPEVIKEVDDEDLQMAKNRRVNFKVIQ